MACTPVSRSSSPLFDRHDKVYAVCGISTDITERKNAEARLRDSHEALELAHDRLKGILKGNRDPIVALDLKYRFLSFNSAFQREFENRFSVRIRQGMRIADVLTNHPQQLESISEQWLRAMRGEEFSVEQELSGGGGTFWFSLPRLVSGSITILNPPEDQPG